MSDTAAINGHGIAAPAHSVEAEQNVLGSLLCDQAQWQLVTQLLRGTDFYRHDHRLIYRSIAALRETGQVADVITVAEHLKLANELDEAGGKGYLAVLARDTALPAHAAMYAQIVKSHAQDRALADIGAQLASANLTPAEKVERARDALARMTPPDPTRVRFSPSGSRVQSALLAGPPDNVEAIVHGLLRRTAGVRVATGGSGKSTLTLYEMVCIILGGDLYGYEVMRPGPCIRVTAEDERQVDEYRLYHIMEQMQLSRPQREQVIDNLYIEDMTCQQCRLVDVGANGALGQTPAVKELVAQYQAIKPAFVSVDPMNFFGPGDRYVNDGEAELMRAGRAISVGLNAAVRFEHHTGKGQARDRVTDQYAGRGGSAGADNARFVHVLQLHDPSDRLEPPKACTPKDVAEGRVLRLHVAKDSYGVRPSHPIWILRDSFRFKHVRPDPIVDVDPMAASLRCLFEFIEAQDGEGFRHTANTLENRFDDLGLTRQKLRSVLHVALEHGHLVEKDLPRDQQHGRKKTYLSRGLRP